MIGELSDTMTTTITLIPRLLNLSMKELTMTPSPFERGLIFPS